MPESTLLIENVVPLSSDQVGLAVLGSPVKHSISPQLHNAAISELANRYPSFSNWVYHKVEVDADNLEPALSHLENCGYRGLNLTIPHKVKIFSIIKSINDEARNIGAVNTLWNDGSEWIGHNSDGYGLEQALLHTLKVSLQTSNLLILGAGGAARAATAQALSRGCKNIWIGNRSNIRLQKMIQALGKTFDSSLITPFEISRPPKSLTKEEDIIIINATSLGLNHDDPAPIRLDEFSCSAKVYDMIYNPSETPLLKAAKSRGMECENGLSMLVFQAVRSLEIWSNKEVSSSAMFSAAKLAF